MLKRHEWETRIKDVEREFRAMESAGERLRDSVARDPTIAMTDPRVQMIGDARSNLEGTYLVRLYAVFENGIREYWMTVVRPTKPPMEVLLKSIASKRRIQHELSQPVDEVRTYRNSIVHDHSEQFLPIRLSDARRRLCMYFSRMPYDW